MSNYYIYQESDEYFDGFGNLAEKHTSVYKDVEGADSFSEKRLDRARSDLVSALGAYTLTN
jgi:hypothetical protein